MASFRNARSGEDIRTALVSIIRKVKDPRVSGMITIVAVKLSGDGSDCKVYISSVDGIEAATEAVKGLNNAAGFIRFELGQAVKIRHVPKLKFYADNSIEHSAHIAKVLDDLGVSDENEVEDTEDDNDNQ